MIGDHHGRTAGRATLLVRAVDGILGTHRGLFWAASRAAEAGTAAALDAIAEAARTAGLDEREVTRTIRSAQRGAGRRPFADREREAG
jgi:hypothetical protein